MPYKKSHDELLQELQDQLAFLRSSAQRYDLGEYREAKRLATSIYILVHDGTGKTKSLLGQLSLFSRLSIFSTSHNPKVGSDAYFLGAGPPLTMLEMGMETATFVPHCKYSGDKLPEWSKPMRFGKWWEEVISSEGRRPLSRRGLVFFARSQDGGAHVDGELDDGYREFVAKGLPAKPGIEYTIRSGDGSSISPTNANWASIRQIAWELDWALKAIDL